MQIYYQTGGDNEKKKVKLLMQEFMLTHGRCQLDESTTEKKKRRRGGNAEKALLEIGEEYLKMTYDLPGTYQFST